MTHLINLRNSAQTSTKVPNGICGGWFLRKSMLKHAKGKWNEKTSKEVGPKSEVWLRTEVGPQPHVELRTVFRPRLKMSPRPNLNL